MTYHLVYDRFINNKPYPNLAKEIDMSQGYSELWTTQPYTLPIRLLYYFKNFNFPVKFYDINEDYPVDSFYPIGIAWFNYDQDIIEFIPEAVKDAVRNKKLRILFYYHEGDHPGHQKQWLDFHCVKHQLPTNYKFVTGNSAVKNLENFVYFPDHESFYWKANWMHSPLNLHFNDRTKDFTVLNRVHKWWRATAMTHLLDSGLLDNSYWSYGAVDYDKNYSTNEFDDNPIEIDTVGLRQKTIDFVNNAPYSCDNLDTANHNMHHTLVSEHFTDSYIQIVFETFFDIENSGGAFLTEKTFKPIKHAQPFIIVGPAGSLALLKKLGYRTFENVIDNSYDSIQDNTKRWQAIHKLIAQLKCQDLKDVFLQCRDDILHNQHRFLSCGYERLETLLNDLNKYD